MYFFLLREEKYKFLHLFCNFLNNLKKNSLKSLKIQSKKFFGAECESIQKLISYLNESFFNILKKNSLKNLKKQTKIFFDASCESIQKLISYLGDSFFEHVEEKFEKTVNFFFLASLGSIQR